MLLIITLVWLALAPLTLLVVWTAMRRTPRDTLTGAAHGGHLAAEGDGEKEDEPAAATSEDAEPTRSTAG